MQNKFNWLKEVPAPAARHPQSLGASALPVLTAGSGDKDLHVLISEAKNLRNGHKSFIQSQLACA